MNGKGGSPISRREFAQRAAIVSVASMIPASALPMQSSAAKAPLRQTPDTPSISPESQAEAEARYQAILTVYGSRFSDEQKAELRRLCFAAQPSLDRLRTYTVENSDAPALYLKPLVEREKKIAPAASPHSASPTPKRP